MEMADAQRAPAKLHRVNGSDALVALLQASVDVRDGRWQGAPSHVFSELLSALERRGFFLGVVDREAE